MIRNLFILLLISLLLTSCGNSNEQNKVIEKKAPKVQKRNLKSEQKGGLIYPVLLIKTNRSQYDESYCKIGDSLFYSSHRGFISLGHPNSKERIPLADLKEEYLVDKMFILPWKESRIFVIWQETDYEGQKTKLGLYKQGVSKPEWKLSFPYTNMGPVVVDGEMAYFTTLGMVGKVNVNTGVLQWKIDSLFNPLKMAYLSFEVPLVFDEKIIFIDFPEPGRRERRDTLFLDPRNGLEIKRR